MKMQISVDRPRPGIPVRSYAGFVEVTGWVAAAEPITNILVRPAGGEWTRAVYGQPRPDVAEAYPKLAHADRSGFQAFVSTGELSKMEIHVEAGRKSETCEVVIEIVSDTTEITVADTDPNSCPWCGCESRRHEEDICHGPFRIVACGRCDFGFADPLPSATDLAKIYEIEYWDNSPSGTGGLSASEDSDFIAGLVAEFGNGGRRSLEVGCGQGTLLLGMQQRGFDVFGQDLSKNAALRVEKEAGISIWRGPLDELDNSFGRECYDVIITRHVIEHSITPRADLCWMREHLNDRGIIILLTPNRRSLAAEILGSTWEWFVPPIHVGYFSPRSLQLVGDVAKLELKMLTTRQGDGAPMIPTLQTFLDYEEKHLPKWQQARCRQILSAVSDGADFESLEYAVDAAGLGQELIAVFTARTPAVSETPRQGAGC